MKKIVLIIVSLLFFLGCGFTPKTSALKMVKPGLTKMELVKVMGEDPHGINYQNGYEIVHYRMYGPEGAFAYYFTFDGDTLIKWEGVPIPRYQ